MNVMDWDEFVRQHHEYEQRQRRDLRKWWAIGFVLGGLFSLAVWAVIAYGIYRLVRS